MERYEICFSPTGGTKKMVGLLWCQSPLKIAQRVGSVLKSVRRKQLMLLTLRRSTRKSVFPVCDVSRFVLIPHVVLTL